MKEFIVASIDHRGRTIKVDFVNSDSPEKAVEEIDLNRLVNNELSSVSYYQIL